MNKHRIGALVAAAALTLTFAGTALADGKVAWTGQGVKDGELKNVDCDASAPGDALFIYTGDSDSDLVLHYDGNTYPGDQKGQGSWHFEAPLPDPLDASQHDIYVEFTGDFAPGELTLSHGCPETTTTTTTSDETTSTTTTDETTSTTTSDETTSTTTSDETTSTTSNETTPAGSVEELTPPRTDAIAQPTSSSTVSTSLLLVFAGLLSAALVVIPAAARKRR